MFVWKKILTNITVANKTNVIHATTSASRRLNTFIHYNVQD